MRQPPIVLYHGNCFDGLTAAWIFRKFRPEPPPEFYPRTYGDTHPLPDMKGREVWVLDFSFPREQMTQIILQSEKTIICDHHKTAEADLHNILMDMRNIAQRGGADKVIFDMSRSGAGITFDVLEGEANAKKGYKTPRHNGARTSWMVDYIEDRDLWRFALPFSESVAAYISSQPMTFESWDAIEHAGLDAVAASGKGIVAYIEQCGEKACTFAKEEPVGGHIVPTMTLPHVNYSDHVQRLLSKHPDAPFAAGYFRRADGMWQFSLRSRAGFDVSEVAKQYGGGGHGQAAGFECTVLPWDRHVVPEMIAHVDDEFTSAPYFSPDL